MFNYLYFLAHKKWFFFQSILFFDLSFWSSLNIFQRFWEFFILHNSCNAIKWFLRRKSSFNFKGKFNRNSFLIYREMFLTDSAKRRILKSIFRTWKSAWPSAVGPKGARSTRRWRRTSRRERHSSKASSGFSSNTNLMGSILIGNIRVRK